MSGHRPIVRLFLPGQEFAFSGIIGSGEEETLPAGQMGNGRGDGGEGGGEQSDAMTAPDP